MDLRSAWKALAGHPAHPNGSRARPGRCGGALVLLLVLVAGLNVTNLTPDWLGAAPYHDHIFFGGGYIPHSHVGDAWSRSSAALTVSAYPREPRAEKSSRSSPAVVSFRSADVVNLVSGAVGLAAAGATPTLLRPPARPRAYPASVVARRSGEFPAPLTPPPKQG